MIKPVKFVRIKGRIIPLKKRKEAQLGYERWKEQKIIP